MISRHNNKLILASRKQIIRIDAKITNTVINLALHYYSQHYVRILIQANVLFLTCRKAKKKQTIHL